MSTEWFSAVVVGGFGFAFGFIGSVPIAGPISALVFRSGVAGRTRRGQGIAVGSAVGEAIYAFLAFWGVGAVFERWPMLGPLSKVAAGVILISLGVVFIRRPAPKERPAGEVDPVGRSAFFIGLGVTSLNPTLIATWTAVTATAFSTGLATYSLTGAVLFAVGVFFGISLWFLLLLEGLDRFRDRVTPRTLDRIVQGMGVFLLVVGTWFLGSAALALALIP